MRTFFANLLDAYYKGIIKRATEEMQSKARLQAEYELEVQRQKERIIHPQIAEALNQ